MSQHLKMFKKIWFYVIYIIISLHAYLCPMIMFIVQDG